MTASEALRQIWTATSAEAVQQPGYYHRRLPFSGPAVYAGIVRPGTLRRLSIEVEKSTIAHANFEDQTRGYLVSVEDRDGEDTDRAFVHLQESGPSPASYTRLAWGLPDSSSKVLLRESTEARTIGGPRWQNRLQMSR